MNDDRDLPSEPVPEPNAAELEEAGVEVGAVFEAEPARVAFEQVDDLPDEPDSDVRIKLESGEEFRERLIRQPSGAGVSISISNALLTEDGKVARDASGDYRIVPLEARHEFCMDAVDAGNMAAERIEAALQSQREVAAAKAAAYFAGIDKLESLLGPRTPITTTQQ